MPFDGGLYEAQVQALAKIDQVIELLATSDRWCKGTLRSPDGRRCLVGAMQAVDAARILRRPILDAIYGVSGRYYSHIEKFNDGRSTTHPLILAVLHRTRENLLRDFGQQQVSGPSRSGFWDHLRAFFV